MAFEAFLTQDKVKPKGRRITYTVSVALHVVLAIYFVIQGFWHVEELTPPTVSVTFMSAPPPPPPPPPPPKKKSSTTKKIIPKEIVQPKPDQVVQPKEEPPPQEEEEEDSGEDDGVEGGVEGGVKGGVVGGVIGGVVGGVVNTESEAPKMLPPNIGEKQIISNPPPDIPPVLARSGMLLFNLVKICVGKGGDVSGVTVVKPSDPLFDKACTDKMRTWKFRPMSVGGNPVPFCYVQKNVLKITQ